MQPWICSAIASIFSLYSREPTLTLSWTYVLQNGPCFDNTLFFACTLSTKFHLLWYSANDTCVILWRPIRRKRRTRHICTIGQLGCSAGPLSTTNIKSVFSLPVDLSQKYRSTTGIEISNKLIEALVSIIRLEKGEVEAVEQGMDQPNNGFASLEMSAHCETESALSIIKFTFDVL